ncbi:hypothetical protein HDU96_000929 [Phlyctochytrium bullatum]|nr:hypothetical protein HDU96_000929 [Phlyctochytrium bullatum]
MNFKRKSVEGLSVGLILTWTFGDVCNLSGAILTNQLRTQVFVAAYFVSVDVVLCIQYVWYTILRPKLLHKQPREGGEQAPLLGPHSGGESVDLYGATGGAPVDVPRAAAKGRKQQLVEEEQAPVVAGSVKGSTLSLDSHEGTLVASSSGSSPTTGSIEDVSTTAAAVAVPRPPSSTGGSSPPRGGSPSTTATLAAASIAVASLARGAAALPAVVGAAASAVAAVAGPVHLYFPASSSALVSVATTLAKLCDHRLPVEDWAVMLGSLAAWCSGLLYVYSRIPQIRENARKGSVEGLSLGNLTYGLSILLRMPTFNLAFIRSDLPYLLGSIGVLSFDILILSQAYAYGELTWKNL